MAVEQRAGQRRDDKTGKDAQERGEAGELGRVIALEHEQDQRHVEHGAANTTKEHARVEARETWNAQERAISSRLKSLQATLTRAERERDVFARRGPAPLDLSGRRPARSSGARRNSPVDEAGLPASCSGVPAAIT